jgi:hypothetical protein
VTEGIRFIVIRQLIEDPVYKFFGRMTGDSFLINFSSNVVGVGEGDCAIRAANFAALISIDE